MVGGIDGALEGSKLVDGEDVAVGAEVGDGALVSSMLLGDLPLILPPLLLLLFLLLLLLLDLLFLLLLLLLDLLLFLGECDPR